MSTPEVAPALRKQIVEENKKPTLTAEHAKRLVEDTDEREAFRDLIKKEAKDHRKHLKEQIKTHHEVLIPTTNVEEETKEKLQELHDEIEDTPTVAAPTAAPIPDKPEGFSAKMKSVMKDMKEGVKHLGSLKTWEAWMDTGLDKAMELFTKVTDFLKTNIAPIMVKAGLDVPPWMKPRPREQKELHDMFAKLHKEGKIKVSMIDGDDAAAELAAAQALRKKEREWIKKNPGKTKQDFYIAVAEQVHKEDSSKKAATASEFLEAAQVILPDAAAPSAPTEDPDTKAEKELPEAVRKGLSVLKDKAAAADMLETATKDLVGSLNDLKTKFSAKRKDELKTQATEQLARTGITFAGDTKKNLETIKAL